MSLLTGDFAVDATDVNVPTFNGSLSLSRTLTTMTPPAERTDATGVFGPGWTAELPSPDAGATGVTLTDQTAEGFATLTAADGSSSVYRTTGTLPNGGTRLVGVRDAADGSVLVKSAPGVTPATFTLTDAGGTRTLWTATTSATGTAAGTAWRLTSVTEPGSAGATTYSYDTAGRVTRAVGPVPAGVNCATAPATTVA